MVILNQFFQNTIKRWVVNFRNNASVSKVKPTGRPRSVHTKTMSKMWAYLYCKGQIDQPRNNLPPLEFL